MGFLSTLDSTSDYNFCPPLRLYVCVFTCGNVLKNATTA